MNIRIGQGFDVHAFAENRPLILGGVTIPYALGLAGHSDADVVIHAVVDALLGAAGLGDIGEHFSDRDAQYKNIDSMILLQRSHELLVKHHWQIMNIDITVLAESPKLSPYKLAMQKNFANALGVELSQVNLKATTTEKLGFVGRGEGIACLAVALLNK